MGGSRRVEKPGQKEKGLFLGDRDAAAGFIVEYNEKRSTEHR